MPLAICAFYTENIVVSVRNINLRASERKSLKERLGSLAVAA
jgi:hypothetical protein